MRNKIILVVAAIALLGVGAFFALQPSPPTETDDPTVRGASATADETREGSDLASVDPGASRKAAERRAPEAAAAVPMGSGSMREDHPWFGQLAGVTGRLVEEDGTPVTSLKIELIEVDATSLLKDALAPRSLKSPDIDATFTGPDGRFLLEGARQSAYHALNIGRGTGRATLRFVEQSLEHGKHTDLGDIVLPAFGTIIGTVIDEDGEPVAGARVRAAPVPSVVVEVGVLDVREGVAVAVQDDGESMVFEVPSRAFTYLDRLPIPMTMSAADGTFRLEGIAPGLVSGGADKAGHVAGIFGPADISAGQEFDVGEVEMVFGREVTGQVTDGGGEPIAGVEVSVGAKLTLAPVAIMHPAGVSDENGQFTIEGIRETGDLLAMARRKPSDDWVVEGAVGLSDSIDIKLPTAKPITVRVNDTEGEPVAGAEIRIRSAGMSGDMMSAMLAMELVGGEGTKVAKATEVETGVYEVHDVTYGKWQFEVSAQGSAPVFTEVEHQTEGTSVTVVVAAGMKLRVTAVDSVTKEPVAHVHATLIGPKGPMFDAYAAGFTDELGVAELGPLSPTWYSDLTEKSQSWFRGVSIVAEHPIYGKGVVKLEEGSSDVVVEMPPSCTVTGRVHWAGENPPGLYMLILRSADEGRGAVAMQMFAPPRTGLTGLEGRFKFTGVAPGEYKVTIMERFLEGDPIALIVGQKEPELLDDRSLSVTVDGENYLDVELSPSGEAPGGRFAGRITSNGSPIADLKVEIGSEEDDVYRTNGLGEFETREYPVMDSVQVKISGPIPMSDGTIEEQTIYQDWRRPESGEPYRIDIDLHYQKLVVQAVDARTGVPAVGVTATLSGERRGRRFGRRSNQLEETDERGMVDVILPDDEPHTLTLSGGDFAKHSRKISSRDISGAEPHLTIELQSSVPCRGVVVLPEGRDSNRAWFRVKPADAGDDDDFSSGWQQANEEDLSFDVKGLMPGRYTAQMWGGPNGMIITAFDLGMNGDESLVLDFENPTPK